MITFNTISLGATEPQDHLCSLCGEKPSRPLPATFESIERSVASHVANRGDAGDSLTGDFVMLGEPGGFEPFQHPELVRIVGLLREKGIGHIGMHTDGGALSDLQMARGCINAGVRIFEIPILSSTPELADRMTAAPGLHAASLRGIANVAQVSAASGVQCFVSALVPLCAHNGGDLLGAVQTAIAHEVDAIRIVSQGRAPDKAHLKTAHELATRAGIACFGDGCDEYLNGTPLYEVIEAGDPS